MPEKPWAVVQRASQREKRKGLQSSAETSLSASAPAPAGIILNAQGTGVTGEAGTGATMSWK